MWWMSLLFLALATLVGAMAIRVTGLGFSLIASSAFVLVLGPVQGVLLTNLMTPVTNVLVLGDTWRRAQLWRTLWLALPAVAMVPLGVVIANALPRAYLLIVIGCLMLMALTVTVSNWHLKALASRSGAVGLGAVSGLFNAMAGLGGVGIGIYALVSKWPRKRFVPSAQIYLLILNLTSLVVKGTPKVAAGTLAVLVLAALLGTMIGAQLEGQVRAATARRLILVLAFAGSLLTIAKGVLALH